MTIENKVVTYKHDSGVEITKTYLELIYRCLDNPPAGGFNSLSEMTKRGDIQEKIESSMKVAQTFEFSEKEIATIKPVIASFPWAFNCKDLREFIKFWESQ